MRTKPLLPAAMAALSLGQVVRGSSGSDVAPAVRSDPGAASARHAEEG